MRDHVLSEVGEHAEPLPTLAALVWARVLVDQQVAPVGVTGDTRLVAHRTLVGRLSRVQPHVGRQVRLVGEGFTADWAEVFNAALLGVFSLVGEERLFGHVPLTTGPTLERLHPTVRPHMDP